MISRAGERIRFLTHRERQARLQPSRLRGEPGRQREAAEIRDAPRRGVRAGMCLEPRTAPSTRRLAQHRPVPGQTAREPSPTHGASTSRGELTIHRSPLSSPLPASFQPTQHSTHCPRKGGQAAALAVPLETPLSAGGSWAAHPTYRCSTTQGLAGSHTPPAGPAASCSWPSAIQKLPRRPPGQPLPPAHCARTPGRGGRSRRGGPVASGSPAGLQVQH